MLTIRPASPADAPALSAIYAHYVKNTAVSFEFDPPTAEEFRARIEGTLAKGMPYLVAEADGVPVGYLYASPFRPRRAYEISAESSIYLSPECRRRGIGRALYDAVLPLLRDLGFTRLYACIASPTEEGEDAYMTYDSRRFHARIGFTECGHFHGCARKFGRVYDMVYMERKL